MSDVQSPQAKSVESAVPHDSFAPMRVPGFRWFVVSVLTMAMGAQIQGVVVAWQIYAITHNPAHKWFWFPRQRREEAIVFKVYDSLQDGRARWTAHTAFDDPTTPPNARPRESIEIRTLAFF